MEIRDIKTHLSILTVLSSYHLKPNRNSMLKCPFHEDKAPTYMTPTNLGVMVNWIDNLGIAFRITPNG